MSKASKGWASVTTITKSLLREGLIYYGFFPTDRQLQRISIFIDEMVRWNKRINLVGLKEEEAIILELIYDAFFLYTCVKDMQSVLDLGSGSGVVSVPLSVLDEGKDIFSIDKSLKKIQFQRHIKRLLGLTHLTVLHGRAQDLPPLNVDAVVAKAFGPPTEALAEGERHLRADGRLFVATGKREKAPGREGFLLERTTFYSLPRGVKEYQLFVYKKISHPADLC